MSETTGDRRRYKMKNRLHTHIDIAQHTDGRWMWGYHYDHDTAGCGYAPLPKWGNFADSEAMALHCAVWEMFAELRDVQNSGASEIRAWLRTLEQPSLFQEDMK